MKGAMKRDRARPDNGDDALLRRIGVLGAQTAGVRAGQPIDVVAPRAHDAEVRLAAATAEIEALRAALGEARAMARTDPLTGLPNRLAFEEAFARDTSSLAPRCLAMVDVDRFKRVNDHHGHGVGDRVLRAIGRGLATACAGQLVARYGGEEFAVLIDGMTLADAAAMLDRARDALARQSFSDVEANAMLGRITVSAGVVAIHPGEPLPAALARADRLLYAAKADGRDRVRAG